jgi:glycosyltransferase involved in cell wall biosynthesis
MITDESRSVLMAVEQLRRPVPGGIGTYTRGLLQGLTQLDAAGARNGEEPAASVTLYASRRTPDPLAQFGRPVTTVALPSQLLTRAWGLRLLRAPGGFEIVHAVSLAAPSPSDRARLVVMVHDLAWRSHPDATTRRGRRWHERALRRALHRAAAFVTPSETVATELVAAGARPDAVRVVAEGADHLPPPDEVGAQAILRASGVGGAYLLAVSTLEPRKNLRRLLDAYRHARSKMPVPLPLVVAGPFGWGDPGVDVAEDGVVPVGHVEGATLAGLYAGAAALAYVPLAEGYGLPPLEAMAIGVPVLASTGVPSVAEERDDPPALLVDPFDVEAIADGLVRIASDDELAQRLRTRGAAFAAGRTWSATAAAHVALWREL